MNNQSKTLRWSVIIGIVIVLNMFFNYTLSLVYKQPDYLTYCPQPTIMVTPTDKPASDAQYQQSITCQKNYDVANNLYSRNVFVALVILGALCVLIGNYLKNNLVLGQSLSIAGVLSFIIASMRYWTSADNLIRVVILAIALLILIWVAIKKFKNTSINSA
jgi:hypothetical protein